MSATIRPCCDDAPPPGRRSIAVVAAQASPDSRVATASLRLALRRHAVGRGRPWSTEQLARAAGMTHAKVKKLLDAADGPPITVDDMRTMVSALQRGDPSQGIPPRPDVALRVMDELSRAFGHRAVPLAGPLPVDHEAEREARELEQAARAVTAMVGRLGVRLARRG